MPLARLRELPCVTQVVRAKSTLGNDQVPALKELEARVNQELDALAREYLKQG